MGLVSGAGVLLCGQLCVLRLSGSPPQQGRWFCARELTYVLGHWRLLQDRSPLPSLPGKDFGPNEIIITCFGRFLGSLREERFAIFLESIAVLALLP